jgi:hypothetical protein
VSVPTLLALVALILALVDEVQARGRSLTGWAVVALALALLWGKLG